MFKQKVIKITLTLNGKDEAFTVIDDQKMNQVSYTGLRTSVLSNFGNGALYPTAIVTVYGLPIEKIDKVIRIKWNTKDSIQNSVKVEVGELGGKLEHFYTGKMTFARLDTSNAPDIALVIESLMVEVEKQKAIPPTSYKEGTKVQDIIGGICKDMAYDFENTNVDITASDIALTNTNIEKIRKLCSDYDLDMYTEHKLIAITNKNEPRDVKTPIISPQTGLIGYPTQTWQGVSFSCLYDPLVRFGGLVEIKDSVVKSANKEWHVRGLRTHLESNTPNGSWSMEVNASWKGADRIVGSN